MLGDTGKRCQFKFLRPLPVGHYVVPASDVRHAPIEQQHAGDVLGVAPLDVQSTVRTAAKRGVEQHKSAGAVRLADILAQGLEHRFLQLLYGVGVS